jgi:hypothetical protein
MNLESTNIITAEALYNASTREDIPLLLKPGYQAMETLGLRGHLARHLMELERQTLRVRTAYEHSTDEKFLTYKADRLKLAHDAVQGIFRRHGHEMPFAEYREFLYGFRVRLVGYKKLIRYQHRVRGAEWRSFPDNVPVVLAYTDSILEEALAKPTGELPSGHTA